MKPIAFIKENASKHRFTAAIVIVIAVAMTMTAISLSLYYSSGTLQLDLSRPGYETARKNIVNPDDTSEFSPYGPINSQTLSKYQTLFDTQRREMNALGNFKDKGLDDASLLLNESDASQASQ